MVGGQHVLTEVERVVSRPVEVVELDRERVARESSPGEPDKLQLPEEAVSHFDSVVISVDRESG